MYPFNECFFSTDSAKMYYILGISVKSYIPSKENNNEVIFRNKNYDLIRKIRECLECRHKIITNRTGTSSYFFSVHNKTLRLSLEERGLTPDKKDRIFPEDIPEEFIAHYIRGFIDNECGSENKDFITNISMYFNHNYLAGLNKRLIDHAGVRKRNVIDDHCEYGPQDTKRIYDFIYKDYDGLYIPSIKNKFNFKTLFEYQKRKEEEVKIKIKKILELLEEGYKGIEISREMKFSSNISFYMFLRRHTGKGVRDFIK